jgi:hypothetical protein
VSTKPQEQFTLDQVPAKWLRELEDYSGVNPLAGSDENTASVEVVIAMATFKRRLDENNPDISFEEMEELPLGQLMELVGPPTTEADEASTPAETGGNLGSSTTASGRGKSRN